MIKITCAILSLVEILRGHGKPSVKESLRGGGARSFRLSYGPNNMSCPTLHSSLRRYLSEAVHSMVEVWKTQ